MAMHSSCSPLSIGRRGPSSQATEGQVACQEHSVTHLPRVEQVCNKHSKVPLQPDDVHVRPVHDLHKPPQEGLGL